MDKFQTSGDAEMFAKIFLIRLKNLVSFRQHKLEKKHRHSGKIITAFTRPIKCVRSLVELEILKSLGDFMTDCPPPSPTGAIHLHIISLSLPRRIAMHPR